MIYFIQVGSAGPIKIGYAEKDVDKRRRALQTAHYEALHLLKCIQGDYAEENKLHARFNHLRLRGEWFKATRELHEFIDAHPAVPVRLPGEYETIDRAQWKELVRKEPSPRPSITPLTPIRDSRVYNPFNLFQEIR